MSNSSKAAESIVIYQDTTCDKTKDFSIFVDNVSQNRTAQAESDPSVVPPKIYNEDGSIFVYDLENQNKREPLKALSEPSRDAPRFEMTMNDQSAVVRNDTAFSFHHRSCLDETGEFDPGAASTRFMPKSIRNVPSNETSRIDFEPAVSSTCFLKPILKSKDNQKKEIDTKNEIFWEKVGENTFNNENVALNEGTLR